MEGISEYIDTAFTIFFVYGFILLFAIVYNHYKEEDL